jgi:TPP-dependent pyruvate/acetoin dehydrogenase alpha subunit
VHPADEYIRFDGFYDMRVMPDNHSSSIKQFYRSMVQIRRFEEAVLDNFQTGVFFGTTHTYLGQEANAVAVMSCLQEQDIVFSNHRCHGHFLAYGGDPRGLFAELMGKSTGVCGGRGGSQHIHWRNFYSNGVQGGIVPVATGMALAEKIKNSQAVTVVFLGDGTLGEGVIYEALNMAALWQAPILYVIENNRIAQTTPAEKAIAGSILMRFAGFGIPGFEIDTSDVLEIGPAAQQIIDEIRRGSGPRTLLLHTCRFGPHSKGDDTRLINEVETLRSRRDPLIILAAHLDLATRVEIETESAAQIERAFQAALQDPLTDPLSLLPEV